MELDVKLIYKLVISNPYVPHFVLIVNFNKYYKFCTHCSHSTSSKDDRTITALKSSLSKQEKDASFLKKEHQRQTLQLKAAEEQINSMRKVLKQKVRNSIYLSIQALCILFIQDEVITQLSDIEPLKRYGSYVHTYNRYMLWCMYLCRGVR